MAKHATAAAAPKGGRAKGHNFKIKNKLSTPDADYLGFGCVDKGCGERRILKGSKTKSK